MREKVTRKKIGDRINFLKIENEKFKLSKISINLITPMKRDTVTANALVSYLFKNGCERYPDQTALNRKLGMMYGAILESDVRKNGDNQIISLTGAAINDSFALEGEKLTLELSRLLCEVLLDPPLENGVFPSETVSLEKEMLKDAILSSVNDKRSYAIEKAIRIMCPDEPFGISGYGYVEDLDALNEKTVTTRWHELVSESAIEIICSGNRFSDEIEEVFTRAFLGIKRKGNYTPKTSVSPLSKEPNETVDTMDIAQTKLVLGFKTGTPIDPHLAPAFSVMTTLYGGGAYSKLFTNVREKMSLCYYCSAIADRNKGVLIADSGIEHGDFQRTLDAMLKELDDVKNGVFTDDEIENAKKSLITSCKSVTDSPSGLESWHLSGILTGRDKTPSQEIELLKSVTRDDVIKAAQLLKPDTVYCLAGGREDE